MLLNPRLADAYKAVRPRLAPDGREVQMEVDQLAGQLSKQSAARSFEVDAGGAELASLSTKPGRSTALESSQNGFARLVEVSSFFATTLVRPTVEFCTRDSSRCSSAAGHWWREKRRSPSTASESWILSYDRKQASLT